MQIRVFTIPALHASEQSVEELNTFLRSHQIASVERQFVADGSNSCLFRSPEGTVADGLGRKPRC
jgi:hypothetical protein